MDIIKRGVLAAALLLAAACGDDSDDGTIPASAETTTTTAAEPSVAEIEQELQDARDDLDQAKQDAADAIDEWKEAPDASDAELAATCHDVFETEDTANWDDAPAGLTADDLCEGVQDTWGDYRCIWDTVEDCMRSWLRDEFSARYDDG